MPSSGCECRYNGELFVSGVLLHPSGGLPPHYSRLAPLPFFKLGWPAKLS